MKNLLKINSIHNKISTKGFFEDMNLLSTKKAKRESIGKFRQSTKLRIKGNKYYR